MRLSTGIGDTTHDIDGSFVEADAEGNWREISSNLTVSHIITT